MTQESNEQLDLTQLTPQLEGMVAIFRALGDGTRMRILLALDRHAMSVGDIAETLAMSQSSISHQLRTLRQLNLVSSERQGKSIVYELADQHIITIFEQTKAHILED